MAECGTSAGWQAHHKLGEPKCQDCKDAAAARAKAYYHANKEKARATRKLWQLNNLDKYREYNRNLYKKDPSKHQARSRRRKIKMLGNGVSKYTLGQVLEEYGCVCYLCEQPIDLFLPRKVGKEGWEYGLHLDHVIPVSKGGMDTLENVAPTHAVCNLNKRGE